jgi:hypothetical protein
MKARIVSAFALVLLASQAFAQQELSLVGTWTGPRERIAKVEGYKDGVATLVITEQKGRTFKGRLTISGAAGNVNDELWGAFTPGHRLVLGADEEGVYSFMLIDQNTLDYCYVEAGASPRAVCARLTRKR